MRPISSIGRIFLFKHFFTNQNAGSRIGTGILLFGRLVLSRRGGYFNAKPVLYVC